MNNLRISLLKLRSLIQFQFLYALGTDHQVHRLSCSKIFESAIEKVDAMKGELYILGDLSCDLLAKSHDCHTKRLHVLEFCELYNLSQLINVPTRITLHSVTVI